MICGRSFGCLRHGNLKYSDYNIAPSNLFEVPENLIFKFKDQIRYEIKKKLSKNHTELCNEDLFYNIFKDFIKWYLDERHYEGIVSYINNNKKILIEWVEKRIVEKQQ